MVLAGVQAALSGLAGTAVMSYARIWPVRDIELPDLSGKTAIVTGANSGIGLELSTRLAAAGATVVLACRNEEKAKQAVESIKKITGKKAVSYEILDVSSQASVRAFVNVWDKRPAKRRTIDFLLLNAGGLHYSKQLTPDKLETTYAMNHHSHFLLTLLLLPYLASDARIVTTGSHTMYGSDRITVDKRNSDDILGKLKEGEQMSGPAALKLYERAKAAQAAFTVELQQRLKNDPRYQGISAFSFHPGLVRSQLYTKSEGSLRGILVAYSNLTGVSVQQGALTGLYLLTSPDVLTPENQGAYFDRCHRRWPPSYINDEKLREELWDAWVKDARLDTDPLPKL